MPGPLVTRRNRIKYTRRLIGKTLYRGRRYTVQLSHPFRHLPRLQRQRKRVPVVPNYTMKQVDRRRVRTVF